MEVMSDKTSLCSLPYTTLKSILSYIQTNPIHCEWKLLSKNVLYLMNRKDKLMHGNETKSVGSMT